MISTLVESQGDLSIIRFYSEIYFHTFHNKKIY